MTLLGREGRSMLKAVKRHGALGTRLVAAARIARGTPFFRVRTDRVRRQPTYQTVQIGPQRHTLSLGILQYINPTLQFLLGAVVYREPFTAVQFVGFVIIWVALLLFALEGLITHRNTPVVVGAD